MVIKNYYYYIIGKQNIRINTRDFNLTSGSPYDGYSRASGNKTYIARSEIKDVDLGDAADIYIRRCIHICASEMHRYYRSKSKATDRSAAEFLFTEHLQRYEIKLDPDVRSKYTYFSSRAFLSSFDLFSVLLFHFTADSKYHEIMSRCKTL